MPLKEVIHVMDWYFPTELKEVPPLLKKEGVVPHGGGTGLLRTGLSRLKGLVDLSELNLDTIEEKDGSIILGSSSTYSMICSALVQKDPGSILTRALSIAASTPLRNRITLGGSIASFPIWSDLMGPLIALGSQVTILEETEIKHPVEHLAANRELLGGSLITGIEYKKEWPLSWYHRHTRVAFDYPLFTLTILLKIETGMITDSRIVVTGTRNRFTRIYELETLLAGHSADSPDPAELVEKVPELQFPERKTASAEQLNYLLRIWLQRGIREITGGERT